MKNLFLYILLIIIILYNSWKNSMEENFKIMENIHKTNRSLRETYNSQKEVFKNKFRKFLK